MSSNKSQSKPPNVYDTAQKRSQMEEIKGEEQTNEEKWNDISDNDSEVREVRQLTKSNMENLNEAAKSRVLLE